jgi:hypothetical protein
LTPEQLRKAADDVEFDQYKNRNKDSRGVNLGNGWDVRKRERAAAQALRQAADIIASLRSQLQP